MLTSSPRTRSTRRLLAALACTGAILLAACGGDDGAQDATDDLRDQIADAADRAGDDGAGDAASGDDPTSGDGSGEGSADAGGPAEVQPPTFVLTGAVDAPDGWVQDPANCGGEESGPPYFAYHVPPDWERRGSGYAGGGGTSGSGDHTYDLPDGVYLEIEVDTDDYSGTDPVATNGPGLWETWDYEITSYTDAGEETATAVFEELEPVEIDGESFGLWYLDQDQAPDLISASEYKVRIVFADVPTGGAAGQDRRPYSATVTFSWNAESGKLDEAVVRDVLATFRVETCAQEALVSMFETINGVTWSD